MNDIRLAGLYSAKAANCKKSNIPFHLTFNEFKRLKLTTKCKYSGVSLDPTSISIERIDNRIGYIISNCVAVHTCLNSIKAIAENPENPIELNHIKKMLKYLNI